MSEGPGCANVNARAVSEGRRARRACSNWGYGQRYSVREVIKSVERIAAARVRT